MSVEIVDNLVRVGAFDALGVRREELLVQVPLVHAQVMGRRGGAGGLRAGRGARPPGAASRGLRAWPGGRRAGRVGVYGR